MASERTFELAFLINLYGTWYTGNYVDGKRILVSDFAGVLDEWIHKLIGQKGTPEQPYRYHEMLFLFQLIMESKSFYATLRNFVRACMDKSISPEPWNDDEWTSGRARVLKSSVLLANIRTELEEAGFTELADEFDAVFCKEGQRIRNAVAHGTFLPPGRKAANAWFFASYIQDKDGSPMLTGSEMSHNDFVSAYKKLLDFRSGLVRVMNRRKDEIGSEPRIVQPPKDACGFMGFKFTNGSMSALAISSVESDWFAKRLGVRG